MREATQRLFDQWWERASGLTRYAPVIVMLATAMIVGTLGYHWE